MTEIDTRWAWSRVEAMADRSLGPADERRMRAAMQRDPRLRAAVESARMLQRELRRLGKEPVPVSLHARLLRIAAAPPTARPAEAPPRSSLPGAARKWPYAPLWSWTSAAAAASTVTVALLMLTQPELPDFDERTAALQEFEVAMAYLQRSYEIAGEQVRRAMAKELREALRIDGDGDGRRDGNGG